MKTKTEEPTFDLLSGLENDRDREITDKIRATDLNTLTPIEAMNLLFELKRMADGQ